MTHNAALLIRVHVREKEDHFYAASTDLPGLHVCGRTREALNASMIKAVKALFRYNHAMDVDVTPVARDIDSFPEMAMANVSDQFVVQRMALAA